MDLIHAMYMELPVYIIHLKRATERAESIRANWDKLGVNYRLIEAVDRRDIEAGKHPELLGKKITAGNVAVNASFIRAINTYLQQFPDENHPGVLIFEDDAIPTAKDRSAFFGKIFGVLSKHALQVLLLHKPQKWDHRIKVATITERVRILARAPFGSVGFFMARSAIPDYRRMLAEYTGHSDHFWNYWCNSHSLGILREPLVLHPPDYAGFTTYLNNTADKRRRRYMP